MLILFDNNVPRGVRRAFPEETVVEARDRGWAALANGELLSAAESAGFAVLLTADKNLTHQQNISGRNIALVVLSHQRWSVLRNHLPQIAAETKAACPGTFTSIHILTSEQS